MASRKQLKAAKKKDRRRPKANSGVKTKPNPENIDKSIKEKYQ